jgi:hypothetical protein
MCQIHPPDSQIGPLTTFPLQRLGGLKDLQVLWGVHFKNTNQVPARLGTRRLKRKSNFSRSVRVCACVCVRVHACTLVSAAQGTLLKYAKMPLTENYQKPEKCGSPTLGSNCTRAPGRGQSTPQALPIKPLELWMNQAWPQLS